MKRIVTLLILAQILVSCHPSDDDINNNVSKVKILTPEESITINKTTIKLPIAARTGTAYLYKSKFSDAKLPIIMVPGTGLTDYIFTDTPDERKSWASLFSDAGHDVYVYNDPTLLVHENIDYNSILKHSSKLSEKLIWKNWRLGKEDNKPYKNTKYPVKHFDSLLNALPFHTSYNFLDTLKVYKKHKPNNNSNLIATKIKVANLNTLIKSVKDCILIVHSASGITGFEIIQSSNQYIKALIPIEPIGVPTDKKVLDNFYLDMPILGIYGDHIIERKQKEHKRTLEKAVDYIKTKGGQAEIIDLPSENVYGNTHLLMQDENNHFIVFRIFEWLDDLDI